MTVLPSDWLVSTNEFGRASEKAITFTYQSTIAGDKYREINAEIMALWPQMLPVADRSSLTQALVIAKVSTASPPRWLAPHALRFVKVEPGVWKLKSLCKPPVE